MAEFAAAHSHNYQKTDRQLSALFEIGCFLALSEDYEKQGFLIEPINTRDGEFRYLTTPNGDPRNFSHVRLARGNRIFEIRQQVRVRSYLNKEIYITPDMVVLHSDSTILGERDEDYAGGKRGFFVTSSTSVVAAHECKSMNGFPELYVSFLGMVAVIHPWYNSLSQSALERGEVGHLAPSLFVGAEASNLHRRLIRALEEQFAINIITGLHREGKISNRSSNLVRLPFADRPDLSPVDFGISEAYEVADVDIPF